MKNKNTQNFCAALGFLTAFVLWTIAISLIDVQAIGPSGSTVGFATINGFVHSLTGVHMRLYDITDWLSLVPIVFMFGFALLGLVQWVKRENILKVDRSILVLGGFYIITFAAYLFFENFVINYRPVRIEGFLEASYPSSTTMLVICVMTTARMQLHSRIQNPALRKCVVTMITVFIALMVIGRLISGVHWLTDIIGGALLSAGLLMLYRSVIAFWKGNENE